MVLMLLALLKESYPSELAKLLDAKLYSIQGIVAALESEGVIVTRRLGRTRRILLSPQFVAAKELEALLWKLAQHDSEVQKAAAAKRGRPRKPGKPG